MKNLVIIVLGGLVVAVELALFFVVASVVVGRLAGQGSVESSLEIVPFFCLQNLGWWVESMQA